MAGAVLKPSVNISPLLCPTTETEWWDDFKFISSGSDLTEQITSVPSCLELLCIRYPGTAKCVWCCCVLCALPFVINNSSLIFWQTGFEVNNNLDFFVRNRLPSYIDIFIWEMTCYPLMITENCGMFILLKLGSVVKNSFSRHEPISFVALTPLWIWNASLTVVLFFLTNVAPKMR